MTYYLFTQNYVLETVWFIEEPSRSNNSVIGFFMDLLIHIENMLIDGTFHGAWKFVVEFWSDWGPHTHTSLFSITQFVVDLQV